MLNSGFRRHRIGLAALAACSLVALSACGSGSSDSRAGSNVTLAGTAATGLAIAGQPVEAKCKGGTGSTTTNADGTYTVTVEGGASLPCMLRVTMAGGEELHSLALGAGNTARANITPVSQLIVARLAGGDPANFYTAFDASAASVLSEENVQAAVVAIVGTLKSAGVDLSGVGDLLGGELVAATEGGGQGNAFDQALDALKAVVEQSGTSLAELTETVARMSPVAATAPTGIASLPAELLLRRAASDCPNLRDGPYRFVHPLLNDPTRTLELDARALTFNWADGSKTTWTSAGEDCKYERDSGFGGKNTMTISRAGVGLMTLQVESGAYVTAVLFPEQTIPVAELAGDWITLEWLRDEPTDGFELIAAELSLDATGKVTAWTDCSGPSLTDCAPEAPSDSAIVANVDGGGFDGAGVDLSGMRAFAYRSGSGDLMMVLYDAHSGSVGYATKKYARAMPAIGQELGGWSTIVNRQGGVYSNLGGTDYRALQKQVHEVTEILSEDTFIRTDVNDASKTQTLKINDPRTGYVHRIAGASETVMLGLRGMNLTPFAKLNDPVTGFFGLSIDLR